MAKKKVKVKASESKKSNLLTADLSTVIASVKGKLKGKKNTEATNEEKIFSPRKAEVNILPRYVKDRQKNEHLRNRFIFIIVSLLVITGAAYLAQNYFLTTDQESSDTLTSQQIELNSQVAQLTPYAEFETNVESKRQAIVNQMSTEIGYGSVAEAITNAANSSGVVITNLSLAATADSTASACPNPDPFNQVVDIGCATFSFSAENSGQASGFLETLRQTPGLVKINIPLGVSETDAASEGTVGFDGTFLTNRFGNFGLPQVDPAVVDPAVPVEAS